MKCRNVKDSIFFIKNPSTIEGRGAEYTGPFKKNAIASLDHVFIVIICIFWPERV